MKYLHTMHDPQIEKDYLLYEINAIELQARVQKNYRKSSFFLQMFNSRTALGELITDVRQEKRRGYALSDENWTVRRLKEAVREVKQNHLTDENSQRGISMGLQLMPIAVSCAGDFSDSTVNVELLDGFMRLLGNDHVPDIDILVKVYPELNDQEWVNAMMVFNSWKFAHGVSAQTYLDRGFQLGLYHRYGIFFPKMGLPFYNLFRYLDRYTQSNDLHAYLRADPYRGVYNTLWNNGLYPDDIQKIYQMLTAKPTFKLKKRSQEEIHEMPRWSDGIFMVFEVFISILGEIRRYESREGMPHISFDMSIFHSFLSESERQVHFVKLLQLSVPGHMENYVNRYLRDDIRNHVYEGMGYVAPDFRTKSKPVPTVNAGSF